MPTITWRPRKRCLALKVPYHLLPRGRRLPADLYVQLEPEDLDILEAQIAEAREKATKAKTKPA